MYMLIEKEKKKNDSNNTWYSFYGWWILSRDLARETWPSRHCQRALLVSFHILHHHCSVASLHQLCHPTFAPASLLQLLRSGSTSNPPPFCDTDFHWNTKCFCEKRFVFVVIYIYMCVYIIKLVFLNGFKLMHFEFKSEVNVFLLHNRRTINSIE